MELTILKVTDWKTSKHGGRYKYVFMKDEATGKSYKTCVFENMRNYQRWNSIIQPGNLIAGCRVRKGNLIDADSQVWLKRKAEGGDGSDLRGATLL